MSHTGFKLKLGTRGITHTTPTPNPLPPSSVEAVWFALRLRCWPVAMSSKINLYIMLASGLLPVIRCKYLHNQYLLEVLLD